ncbi:guanylate kinase [Fusarium redolens]|uniref:guanylate kinase n=1 Tax=Fusarium redolens TaxID=48865 RepID=A0A9P9KGQ6_FUSRE|nr:guanylate kinase [Fusarium redolens]KAH7260923.1 guanylate kinase [Fusarium redolens]
MGISDSQSPTNNLSTAIPDNRPIIVSGPSGVGKSTLNQRLKDNHPAIFSSAVSHTTRKPRPGESEGVAYFFRSPPEFQAMIMQNQFIEHTYFSDNYYGTSKQAMTTLMNEGLTPILDIEMQGVFLKPLSLEILEMRLRARGTEDEASISKRLAQAQLELEFAETGVHDIIIVNDDLERAYKELEEVY